MGTPPNPFDQAAVDKYLAEQQSREAEKQAAVAPETTEAPETGAAPDTGAPVQDNDPAVEARVMMDYWARRGPDVLTAALEAVAAELDSLAAGVERDGTNADHLPVTTTAAELGKLLRDSGASLYQAARVALWGHLRSYGSHTLPDGRQLVFKSGPATRRSTDYKALKADHPAVYRAVVKETPVEPGAPGILSIKGRKKK